VDLEDQRVLLAGIEVRRLENPALNVFAVEALVPDLFGLALLDAFEQIVVDVSDLRDARLKPSRLRSLAISASFGAKAARYEEAFALR